MKRLLKGITILLVISLVLCAICSCVDTENETETKLEDMANEQERAFALLERSDKKTDELNSYQVDGTVKMKFPQKGLSIDSTATNISIYTGRGTGDYADYSKDDILIKFGRQTLAETVIEKGFFGGKMYQKSTEAGEQKQAIYSEISANDYLKFKEKYVYDEDLVSSLDFKAEDLSKVTCVKKDGDWIATFSEFNKYKTASMIKAFVSGYEDEFEATDVKIEVTADDQMQIKSINIEFVFEDEDEYELSISSVVSKHNSATLEAPSIDSYKLVADLRVLDMVVSELSTKKGAGADFTLTLTEAIGISSSSGTMDVSYKDDASFSYTLKAEQGTSKATVVYENKEKKNYDESDKLLATKLSDDETERAYIYSLLDYAACEPTSIENITQRQDGSYDLFVSVPFGSMYEQYEVYVGSFTNTTMEIHVKFDGDKLVLVDTELVFIRDTTNVRARAEIEYK